ncbi:hypothetical protein QYM36_011902 [Artemia franciscana]|uniref:Uncharacterized protein n=1 Tax=Artemia franciscana TaxID=6661 RepID=A0AA88HMR4_ARTSF|nr:hypothetical protein QYM36_011902 [Artemia franciscana]
MLGQGQPLSPVALKLQFYEDGTYFVHIAGLRLSNDLNLLQPVMNVNKPEETNINDTIKIRNLNMYLKASKKFEGEYHFHLKEGTILKVHPARWIQLPLEIN